MTYLNLYPCAKLPTNVDQNDTDGINLYGNTEPHDCIVDIHKYDAANNFSNKRLICTIQLPFDNGVIPVFEYRIINEKTYVVLMSIYREPTNITLVCDGIICHTINVRGNITRMYGYREKFGYFSSIIGCVCSDSTMTEYFIDPIENKICKNVYCFNRRIIRSTHLLLHKTRVCLVLDGVIDVIDRSSGDMKQITLHDDVFINISRDGLYLYTKIDDEHITIYDSSTFKAITRISTGKKTSVTVCGNIGGFIFISYDASQIFVNHGNCFNVESGSRMLYTHFDAMISHPSGDICRLGWEWRYYNFQRLEIKQRVMFIYMLLRFRCGFCRHLSMMIGAIALS